MNKSFYSEDGKRVAIETDDWTDALLRFLGNENYVFVYTAEERIDIQQVVDNMVVPMLFYTLIEMSAMIEENLKAEVIAAELRQVLKQQANNDNHGYLSLTYDQAAFVEKYKKEVKAWLPITIKKHVYPNSKRIKDLLDGNI